MQLAICCMAVVSAATSLHGGERLEMRLSPHVMSAPGLLKITVIVERDAENRSLKVEADSTQFYRSSTIQMDGDRAPRVQSFSYAGLPPGKYLIRVALFGSTEKRAAAQQSVEVLGGADDPDVDDDQADATGAVP